MDTENVILQMPFLLLIYPDWFTVTTHTITEKYIIYPIGNKAPSLKSVFNLCVIGPRF